MSNSEPRIKVAYSQPKLAIYGGFSKLTAAGSMNRPENGPGQTGMRA